MVQTVSPSNADSIVRRTTKLLGQLFPSPRGYGISLWDGSELPVEGHPSFHLVLKHAGALRRMFSPPIELSLGEAFILKDFDIEGDIFSAFSLMDTLAARTFSLGEVVGIGFGLLALPASGAARPQRRRNLWRTAKWPLTASNGR